MFVLRAEPAKSLLRIHVSGFWDAAVLASYMTEVRAALATMQAAGGCRRIMIDMSNYPVQTRAIAEAHGQALRLAHTQHGIRAAILMTSALARLQASSVAADTGYRMFDDAKAAEAWLLGEDETVRAA